jgi:hypothetical protein
VVRQSSLPTAVLAIFDFLPFFIQTDETCDLNWVLGGLVNTYVGIGTVKQSLQNIPTFISNMIRNRAPVTFIQHHCLSTQHH